MRSAALPDLNTGYNTYRKQIIMALSSRNYDLAYGFCCDLNGILPKEYQITISTIQYNEKLKEETLIALCKECKTECKSNTLKIRQDLQSDAVYLFTGNKYQKVWECPKCHHDNLLSKTEFERRILPKPIYFKIVPYPPEKATGLVDTLEYERKIKAYIQQFLLELEHQMGLYRIEYVPKDQREADDLENTEYSMDDYT